MKSLLLSFLTFTCAAIAHAELKYIAYNLDDGTYAPLDEVPEVTHVDYRNGSTLLMVQDTSISTEYYIGVFEVTNAQAEKLGWSESKTKGVAIAAYAYDYTPNMSTPPSLATFPLTQHPYLSFPTEAEWKAYAGSLKTMSYADAIGYNIGKVPTKLSTSTYTPETWPGHSQWPWTGIDSATHGVYDMYGNVVEITQEGSFIGGCAAEDATKDSKFTLTGTTLSPELLGTTETSHLDIMANGYVGARLVFRPTTTFTVTIKVNDQAHKTISDTSEGDTVTFTMPEAPSESMALYDIEVTPQEVSLSKSGAEVSFEMPAGNVEINYIYKTYVNISVVGGTTSESRCVCDGLSSVTLLPAPPAYATFKAWSMPTAEDFDASMVSVDDDTGALTFTPTDALTPGATYTFEALYDRYPQVYVYGGVATVVEGTSFGDGYYTPGTKLQLSAPSINGYNITWTRSQGDHSATIDLEEVVVGVLNAPLEIYTATYTPAAINTVDATLPTFEGDLAFGYSTTPQTVNIAGNRYTFTTLQAVDNVVFNLDDQTHATNVNDLPIGEANKLTFIRVDPKTIDKDLNTQISPFFYMSSVEASHRNIQDDYHALEPYYLAASEFTQGQYNKLFKIQEPEGVQPSPYPYNTTTQAAALEVIARLKTTLHDTIALPTQYECEAAALIGYTKDHQASGNYPQTRVAYNGGRSNVQIAFGQPVTTSGQTFGGFYGLIGNYGEWTASDVTRAYSGGYDSITNNPILERLMSLFISSTPASLTCRPKIPSPRPETITITIQMRDVSEAAAPDAIIEQTMTVPKGKAFDLGAPAIEGYMFVGWRVNDATSVASGTTFVADEDTTYIAVHRPLASIQIEYDGCTGAPALPPGGQTYLYTTTPALSWTVMVNGVVRDNCVQDGLLTIPADATTITVKANISAPGYRLRLK